MRVRHPQYGVGTVKTIAGAHRGYPLEPRERIVFPKRPTFNLRKPRPRERTGAATFGFRQGHRATILMNLDWRGAINVEQLGIRWHKGPAPWLHPADVTANQRGANGSFLHKIVMIATIARAGAKINAHPAAQ